ncbi:hypothetical protein IMSAG049_01733 [Clostridiales bacterium]|nr:hypothetical protein IMSAG049_01733 [Clostridiales bacterium]
MKVNSAEIYRIPMAVTEVYKFWNGNTYPVCPQCHISLEREYQSYCDRCGQCLDWRSFKNAKIVLKI